VLNQLELLLFLAQVLIVLFIIIKNYTNKDPVYFWAPTTVISLVYIYYAILGPYLAIKNNETFFRLTEHRPFAAFGWGVTLVGLIAFLIGYSIVRKHKKGNIISGNVSLNLQLAKYGYILFGIGILSVLVLYGTGGLTSQINIFYQEGISQGYQGIFRNYFIHGISFFITASSLILLAFLRKRTSLIILVFIIMVALAIYTKAGFRWRHVMLGLSFIATYYLFRQSRPNPLMLGLVVAIGVYILGYIGMTRQYGRGLDIEKMEESTGEEVMDSGFAEGYIFFTTGLLVGMVPNYFDYIYFDPLIQSITMPVPRALWKGKPSGDYIQIYNRLYGEERYGQGVAVLNFGEYYLAFGWIGVIIGGFLLGFIYKKLWLWYLNFRNNDYAIVLYTVSVSFIFVIISRGYLPQVTMTFFFCVGPAWLIWRNHYIQMRRFLFRKQDDSVSGSAVNN